MTDTQGGEAAEVVTKEGAHEAPVSSQERDYDAEAAEQGWRPQDEWTGKPEHWKDAKTWVENGETKSRIAKVERDYAERFDRLEKTTNKAVEALKASHAKEIDGLKAERRAAIKEGDADKVEEIDQKIDKANTDNKEEVVAKVKSFEEYDDNYAPDNQDGPEYRALVSAFMTSNAWMIEEPEMSEYARDVSRLNADAHPGIGFKANMKFVAERVRRKFPAYFADIKETAANGHAAVDGGGFAPGAIRSRTKGFAELPDEAKRAYDRFDPKVKAALSKDQYAKEYNADA